MKLVIITEEYTSQLCSCCRFRHQRLGRSKVFDCPLCSTVMDRDENGARNMLLKSCMENEMALLWVVHMRNVNHYKHPVGVDGHWGLPL